jgi:NADH-quinone oxidoreductase subunit M
LGGYGLVRFTLPLFPNATLYFRPLILVLCLIGAIYAGLVAIVQVDLKKIVAYSSVSHMNFAVLGIFTLNVDGVLGGLLMLLAHGFTSAALFFLVGVIYRRCHTRLLAYYSGLSVFFPLYSMFFLFFFFSNIGFPGTLNFVAEFLIFFVLVKSIYSFVVFILLIFVFLASLGYSI